MSADINNVYLFLVALRLVLTEPRFQFSTEAKLPRAFCKEQSEMHKAFFCAKKPHLAAEVNEDQCSHQNDAPGTCINEVTPMHFGSFHQHAYTS